MGGKIGYKFALDHPDVLKAVVLVWPSPPYEWMPREQQVAMKDMVMMMMFATPEGIRGYFKQTSTRPLSEEEINELSNGILAMDPAAKDESFARGLGLGD